LSFLENFSTSNYIIHVTAVVETCLRLSQGKLLYDKTDWKPESFVRTLHQQQWKMWSIFNERLQYI